MDKFPPFVGEVIIRRVDLVPQPGKGTLTYRKQIAPLELQKSERDEHMFWARRAKELDNLWVAGGDKGLTCFIKGEVPENFTHFTITQVARAGRAVYVTAGVWDEKTLLDLHPAPGDSQKAYTALVKKVTDIIQKMPDVLPMRSFSKCLNERQFKDLVTHWVDTHPLPGGGSRKEAAKALLDTL